VVLPLHVFWFNYQNIWIVMTEGITNRQAYPDRDRLRLGTVYAVATVMALWIAVGWWTLIGAM
jgi:hypothetical protein